MKNLLKNQTFYLVIIILFSCGLFLVLSYYILTDAPRFAESQKPAVPAVAAIIPAIDTAILNNMDSNRLNKLRRQLKAGFEAKVNRHKVGAEISGRKSR